MFSLVAIAFSLINVTIQPASITIDIDTPVARIWVEVEVSPDGITIAEWGT